MICLQLFLARTCYFWRKKRKKAFGIQMFFVQFCQYKWYTSGIYHLPPIFREPETATDFEFSVKFFFSEATNPRPFGTFRSFSLDRRNTSCLAAGEVGVGEGYDGSGEKTHHPKEFKGWILEDDQAGKLRLFPPKTSSKVVVVEINLEGCNSSCDAVTTQKIDSG